jgi:ubiquinone biosynthesis protein UbiJ
MDTNGVGAPGLADHASRGFSLKNKSFQTREYGGDQGVRAYNPCMLHTLQQLIGTALMERFTLTLNHVLASEPAALLRLKPHAGRCIRVQLNSWPSVLPPLPQLAFMVTPAGLLDWCASPPVPDADLLVTLDASNPARMLAQGLAGQRPAVEVAGDGRLATDVSWLMDNLRWDLQDDLARLIGPAAANELARVGRVLAGGLREAVSKLSSLAARARGEAADVRAKHPVP